MRSSSIKIGGIVVALCVAPVVVAAAAVSPRPPLHPLAPISAAEWQPRAGDVIFRASEDVIGGQIRAASGDDAVYSHVGMVVEHGGRPMVVDVSPFGGGTVKFTDVGTFTEDPEISGILVARPRHGIDGAALSRRAERIAADGVAFDYSFDMQDARELYCAELVYTLLQGAGADLRSVEWSNMYIPMRGLQPLVTPDALARSAALVPLVRRVSEPD